MDNESQIEIEPLYCNHPTHDEQQIEALCLRTECKYPSAQCSKCILKLHQNCVYTSVLIEDIPQLLKPFLQFQQKLAQLLQLNHHSKLIHTIEYILLPISTYFVTPNIKSFNELGNLLKESERIQKEVKGLFEQCKEELSLKDGYQKCIPQVQIEKDFYEQGKQLLLQNKYQEALDLFEQALKIDSFNYLALNAKGSALSELNRIDESIHSFEQAILINPIFFIAWQNKGMVLLISKKYFQAIESFEEALKINPQLVKCWRGKGIALYSQGKYEEAIVSYDRALKLDKYNKVCLSEKGQTLYSLLRYNESIYCFEEAISIDPEYPYALEGKGKILMARKQYQQAIYCFDKALKVDSKHIAAWNRLALKSQCKYEAAIQCFSKSLKIEPNNNDIKSNLQITKRALEFGTIRFAIDHY